MKHTLLASAVFLLAAGQAFAGPGSGDTQQPADPPSGRPSAILDDAKCTSLWSITQREGDTLSEDKAAPFIVNFKLVDANSDLGPGQRRFDVYGRRVYRRRVHVDRRRFEAQRHFDLQGIERGV
jgi:hypothetical protein